MKIYASLIRIRFLNGLQYRTAAAAGLSTQFAWGFMEILAFMALYRANPAAFPMEFSQTVSYIWLQQGFLALFFSWGYGADAAETIVSGNIAYDMARPIDIYNRWFCETIATRLSRGALRCMPVLIVALLLPAPMNLSLPASPVQFLVFIVSMIMAMCVVTAFGMLDIMTTFYTMSRMNLVFAIVCDFLGGAYIPLPFFPDRFRNVLEILPFASMQNLPLRIYSGHISGAEMHRGLALQVFWLVTLVLLGKWVMNRSLKRVVTQGG